MAESSWEEDQDTAPRRMTGADNRSVIAQCGDMEEAETEEEEEGRGRKRKLGPWDLPDSAHLSWAIEQLELVWKGKGKHALDSLCVADMLDSLRICLARARMREAASEEMDNNMRDTAKQRKEGLKAAKALRDKLKEQKGQLDAQMQEMQELIQDIEDQDMEGSQGNRESHAREDEP